MDLILFLQSYSSPALDGFAQAVSDLGSTYAYIVLLLTIYLGVDSGLGRRVGIWFLVSFVLNFYLKGWIGTDRPFVLEPELNRSREENLGFAFPSGHTQAATTFWGYLAARVGSGRFWVAASALVAAIGLTRIYLGVHWPIDVLGGLLIGAGVVLIGLELDRRAPQLLRRTRPPVSLHLALTLLAPLTLAVVAPPPGREAGLLLGALAAFLSAPTLYPFETSGPPWRRALLVLLGLALVFGVLLGSSALLPEDLKRVRVVDFTRYLLLGWTGLLLAPWLGRRIGLTPPAPRR